MLANLSGSAHALRMKTVTSITQSHERVLKKKETGTDTQSYYELHVVYIKKEQNLLNGSIHVRTNAKKPGPEVIKLFSCSTQLSIKFIRLINIKNDNNYWHFNIYKHDKYNI